MPSHNLKTDWNRKDEEETEVVVHFTFHTGSSEKGRFGSPEDYDPGSDPEIEIDKVVAMGGEVVTFTKEETDDFKTHVVENAERYLPPDGPDPDDERDRMIESNYGPR